MYFTAVLFNILNVFYFLIFVTNLTFKKIRAYFIMHLWIKVIACRSEQLFPVFFDWPCSLYTECEKSSGVAASGNRVAKGVNCGTDIRKQEIRICIAFPYCRSLCLCCEPDTKVCNVNIALNAADNDIHDAMQSLAISHTKGASIGIRVPRY